MDRISSSDGSTTSVDTVTIREALLRLSSLGLVDFQEQRGFLLPVRSPQLQHDLTQFRIFLEAEGACLSIRSGDVGWEARLAAAHHKLSHIEMRARDRIGDVEILRFWAEAEREFHQTLIDACGSEVLKSTHAGIYDRFRQQVITIDRNFVYVPENIIQHKAILDAVLARDEALTRKRITEHLARNLIDPPPT